MMPLKEHSSGWYTAGAHGGLKMQLKQLGWHSAGA